MTLFQGKKFKSMSKTTSASSAAIDAPIERHPWPPFIPSGAKVLFLGTFPPGEHRWSMNFYYPNPINDFWRIMGLIFLSNKDALWLTKEKKFDVDAIKKLMTEKHIALNDTAREIRRLKGNASDKYLEIVKQVPLDKLLREMPDCHALVTTGEKAARVISELTATPIPKMGEMVTEARGLEIWRMPSTSRAFPMRLEVKAEYYRKMFMHLGIIEPKG